MRLEVADLTSGYGRGAAVLHGAGLSVGASEIVTVLGRNGVGKTTLLRTVMGMLATTGGSVRLDGTDISALRTYRRARLGLGYVPQGRELFPRSTVEQNLRYGHLLAGRSMRSPLPDQISTWFPWLDERPDQTARTLSGGEQQMVAIARVLVGSPMVLLLDEPTEGLAPIMVQQLAKVIRAVAETSTLAILLVEQNVAFALGLASRGYIMEKGRMVAEGPSADLGSDKVITRYLSV